MRPLLAGILLCGLAVIVFGQNASQKVLNREVTLLIENDVFTSILLDQYYSSGIYASYRDRLDSAEVGPRLIQVIRNFKVSQRMYTANSLAEIHIENMDRPYAGILSFMIGQSYYFKRKQALEIELELGWMGPRTGTGQIQRGWHKAFGLQPVNGWDSQISDSPVINAHLRHGIEILRSNGEHYQPDIILDSRLSFGSVFNSIHEQLVFRFGRTLPVNQTGYFGNTLGLIKPDGEYAQTIEVYIMYSPGIKYTLYDGTLQGGLLSWEPSVFTKEPNPWVFHQKFGLLFRYGTFDFNFVVHLHKPETEGVTSHQYAGVELKQRF